MTFGMRELSLLCLVLSTGNAPVVSAEAVLKTEDVVIPAGTVTLAGRLYLPPGKGPFPAIVFTHGSGPTGRDSPRYKEEAEAFAGAGIASLVYDKRGYGQSTGDWKTATFEDLAADAIAAVHFLKARPEIRPRAIGLRGQSQAGWVLPIVATRSSDAAFLILISPPGVTPYEQILYDVRTDLEDAGFRPPDVEAGVALTRSGLDYARSGKGWEGHAKGLEAAAHQKWLEIASGPPDPNDWLWKWVHPVIDFDSVPLVRSLKIPVLVVLAEDDRETPSQVAGYRFAEALQANPKALVRYFPSADHDLRSTKEPKQNGRAPFAPGFLETMQEFVHKLSPPD